MNNVNPNERQVGGDHYRKVNAEYQHWDMAAQHGLNYFTANATKYISRWREKDGAKSIEKAIHYVDKLISLYQKQIGQYRWDFHIAGEATSKFYKWCELMHFTALETTIMELAVMYANQDDLLRMRRLLTELLERARVAPQPAAPSQPTSQPQGRTWPTG